MPLIGTNHLTDDIRNCTSLNTTITLVTDLNGHKIRLRSILDGGSSFKVLSESACWKINLKTKSFKGSISWINGPYQEINKLLMHKESIIT